jgi:WD40 repeat protein
MRTLIAACALGVLALTAAEPAATANRKDLEDPELIVDSGGRLGMCDVLLFTPDGRELIAVGDDKVVRIWQYRDGKLDPATVRVLRWGIWREQRGAMKALAVSPDGRRIAVGGAGVLTSTVSILRLASGDVEAAKAPPFEPGVNGEVMALTFAPSGTRVAFGAADGSVWVWDFVAGEDGKVAAPRRLGGHASDEKINRVRMVHFTGENSLLSAAEFGGDLLSWDAAADNPKPKSVLHMKGVGGLFRAELSPDEKWLAAAAYGSKVELFAVDGSATASLPLEKGETARSIAFDPKGRRLAVGVRTVVEGSAFRVEGDDRIVFYDLTGKAPKPSPGPPHKFRADCLTFHPTELFLAVAGGDDHEVTLWDLADLKKPSAVAVGRGTSLWGVGLSADGEQLGVRDRRDAKAADPNARGAGPWRVFNLATREWQADDKFEAVAQLDQSDGWRVEPHATDQFVWYAVHKAGPKFALPLDGDRDGMPTCYTFIPAVGGRPLRLAVGHIFGLSIYEVSANGVRRSRLCVGHQGYVTALAVSKDREWLISASEDQTVAAWSLSKEWPSQATVGAAFELKNDRLLVTAVDAGGPAWEAGLVVGDEVTAFSFASKGWQEDHKDQWLERLTSRDPGKGPEPGKEHALQVRRGKKTVKLLTTLKQRPLWRFFPARDNEWVLWMWRNSYYDSSTNGDFCVGWHVNNAADPLGKPTFYRAEQFRKVFRRPDVIDKLLAERDVFAALQTPGADLRPVRFTDLAPQAVKLTLDKTTTDKEDLEAKLQVAVQGVNPDNQPQRAEIWVNGCCLDRLDDWSKWKKEEEMYRRAYTIPAKFLRAGENVVTLQVYNAQGARAETSQKATCRRPAPAQPKLFVVAVGVNDYKATAPAGGKRELGDLESARADAEAMAKTWGEQVLYAQPQVVTLLDEKAQPQQILDALAKVAGAAGPDDRCVVFLAGHGDALPIVGPKGAKSSKFVFCGPSYTRATAAATGLTDDQLYRSLSAVPCRALVLIDACHSGAASKADNPVRGLTPGGQGPVVLSACDVNQQSLEDPKELHHGLFTAAVLKALDNPRAARKELGDQVAESDKAELTAKQLYDYTVVCLPQLLKGIHEKERLQVPTMFAPPGESYKVASGK